ncbi:MAG: ABC transporter permease subunit [Ktedonobacteraceae bacterium]|nr:ABC transporter permease subunit [Ktedonobacteraceae bacterium]
MFWNVLLLETDKLFKRALFWIELAVLVTIIIVADVVQYLISTSIPSAAGRQLTTLFTWPTGLENAAQFADAHILGGLLLIILLSMLTAQEYSWRTYHLWLGRGISRSSLLGAKCLVALIATFLVVLTSVIVSSAVTGVLTLVVKGSLPFQQINVAHFLSNISIVYYSLLPYVALAFLLSIISRSVILAISVGLVFLLFIEGTIYTIFSLNHGIIGSMVQYLPIGLETALQATKQTSTSSILSVSSPPLLVAVLCIALYVAVFVGLGFWRFFGQNFTD